jgi:hypothetical protein
MEPTASARPGDDEPDATGPGPPGRAGMPASRRAGWTSAGRAGLPSKGEKKLVPHLVDHRDLRDRAIAEALVVSERTAQNHVQHILTPSSGSLPAVRSRPGSSPADRQTSDYRITATQRGGCVGLRDATRSARGSDASPVAKQRCSSNVRVAPSAGFEPAPVPGSPRRY